MERAWTHIHDFGTTLVEFWKEDPYDVSAPEPNPKGDGYVVRLQVRREVPFELGLIAADAVHNLRASLDNMVWLAHGVAGKSPPRAVHFPIEWSHADYAHEASWTLAKLPTACFWAIEQLQPYNGPAGHPERHPAAILNRLWNRDKHRATPLTYLLARAGSIVTYDVAAAPQWRFNLGPVEHNQVIAYCDTPNLHMSDEPHVALEVAIHNSGAVRWLSASEVLIDLYEFVRLEAFPALDPFL